MSQAAAVPGIGVPGRRTVTIHGRGAERYRGVPERYRGVPERRRPARRPYERSGFKPDRAAMWAVLLGVLMILAAATSSHAAMLAQHSIAAPQHPAAAAQRHPALAAHRTVASARLRDGAYVSLRPAH